MENYNLLHKDTVKQDALCPIDKIEYMLIENIETNEQVVVFKLFNNSSYLINSAEITIDFINEFDDVLDTQTYTLDNLNLKPHTSKIPLQKMLLLDGSVKININILDVALEEYVFEEEKTVEEKEVIVEDTKPYKITNVKYKGYKFPYFLTFSIVVLFSYIIVSVFNMLN